MKRLNKKGETIVETLVAILIVAVCFLMLQTSIVSSAKINKSSSNQNTPFNKSGAQKLDSCTITIGGEVKRNLSINCYKTSDAYGGYYYYE